MFKHAIVKTPCANMVNGITEAGLGQPDYQLALQQHQQYIEALQQCGVEVSVLPADEQFPDSCFVEDPAVITQHGAIITHPGADSRKGETKAIEQALLNQGLDIQHIKAPGTLDGGDVMMVDKHFYIGLSDRTNQQGAQQLIGILEQQGMSGETVEMNGLLHLKTGLSYLENNRLLVSQEMIGHPAFESFNLLTVPAAESYAANCIWINGQVIVPKGFPKSQAMIEQAGYSTIAVDVSEFRKLDGGLSCLSLRF
ncbi:MAG: arginine deiminase family protein [Marinicella sp.]